MIGYTYWMDTLSKMGCILTNTMSMFGTALWWPRCAVPRPWPPARGRETQAIIHFHGGCVSCCEKNRRFSRGV